MDAIAYLKFLESLPREERCKMLGIPVETPKGVMNPVMIEALNGTADRVGRMGYLLRAIRPMISES